VGSFVPCCSKRLCKSLPCALEGFMEEAQDGATVGVESRVEVDGWRNM